MHPDFIVEKIRLLMLLCRKHTGKSNVNIGPKVLFFKILMISMQMSQRGGKKSSYYSQFNIQSILGKTVFWSQKLFMSIHCLVLQLYKDNAYENVCWLALYQY